MPQEFPHLATVCRLTTGPYRFLIGGGGPWPGMAFASLYKDGKAPFFVLALPDVWKQDPGLARKPDLKEIIPGVISHEIVHTRQLVAVGKSVDELRSKYGLPGNLSQHGGSSGVVSVQARAG